MAYKFQLGAFTASGSIKAEEGVNANDAGVGAAGAIAGATTIDGSGDLTMGTITMTGFSVDADGDTALKSLAVDDSSTIGCDSDADIMTLAAQSLALANDVDFNIAKTAGLQLGGVAVSSTAAQLNQLNSGQVSSVTQIFATDLKLGEDDQTKIDFEDENKINFYANNSKKLILEGSELTPGANDGTSLGSAGIGWSDLYLADGGRIQLGNDQDVFITHVADEGVAISTPGDGGSGPKAVLSLLYDSASPDDGDFVGAVKFKGDDDGGNITSYAEIAGVSKDVTDGTEDGALTFDVLINGTKATMFDIGSTAASTVTVADGAFDFDVASHDGTNGLKLGGTLVTATAAELNYLDNSDLAASDLQKLADLTVTAAELNVLDGLAQGSILLGDGSGAAAITDIKTSGQILVGNGTTAVSVAVSGDASLAANGALTVANDAIDNNKLANIARGSIKVGGASNAPTDLDAKTSGQIIVGDGTDVASVAVSGDATLAANGALTMAAAQTNITSLLATDIKIGEDDDTKIDFGTPNEIKFNCNGNQEMVIDDNGVVIAGNLTVNGTTVSVNATTINITSSFTFEGPADDHETTLTCGSPTADATLELFQGAAGTYFMPAFSDTNIKSTVIASTAAELNLLDGGNSRSSVTLADGDGFILNDDGVMKQATLSSIKSYVAAGTLSVVQKSNGQTLDIDEVNYFATQNSNIAVTLPASSVNNIGKSVYIKAGDLTGGAVITINTAASAQKVDGADSIVLESPFAAVRLIYVAADDYRVF